jgi:hypothetical protein
VIITINSGNNKLSCVVQKITIDLRVAIAIDTKDVTEALNQIEVNQGSRRGTQKRNIGEMSDEMTDARIDERKSGMKGGKKDATIDVTRSEASEVGLVTENQIVKEIITVDTDHQNAEIDIKLGQRMAKVEATNMIARTVKCAQTSNNKTSLLLALKSNNQITALLVPKVTKVKFQPWCNLTKVSKAEQTCVYENYGLEIYLIR